MKKSSGEQIKLMRLITGKEMKNREDGMTTNLFQNELDRARTIDSDLRGSLKDAVSYLHKNPLGWQKHQFSLDYYGHRNRERIGKLMQTQTSEEHDPFYEYDNPYHVPDPERKKKLEELARTAAKRFDDVFLLKAITTPFYHSLESTINLLTTEDCGSFRSFALESCPALVGEYLAGFQYHQLLRGAFVNEIRRATGENFGDEDKGIMLSYFSCGDLYNEMVYFTEYKLVPTETKSSVFQDIKKAEVEGLFSAVGSFTFQRYKKAKTLWDFTSNNYSAVSLIKTHELPCIIALDTCGILYIAAQESDVKNSKI